MRTYIMKSYILLAMIISFLWGIEPVIHKYLLQHINGITIMLITSMIYYFCVASVSFQHRNIIWEDMKKMSLRLWAILIVTALFTIVLGNFIYYYILKDHESSFVASLIYSSPIFTLVLSYMYLNEVIDLIGIIGILLVVLGVICISMNGDSYKLFEYFLDA